MAWGGPWPNHWPTYFRIIINKNTKFPTTFKKISNISWTKLLALQ